MIRGSHNSMTFLPPKNWLMRLFTPFWRCQSKDLRQQFDAGCRCFDLRVRIGKHEFLTFAHGLAELQLDGYKSVLDYCDDIAMMSVHSGEKVYIRLILEDRKKQSGKFAGVL